MVLHALNLIALYGVNAALGIIAIWLLPMPRPLPFLALSVGVMPFISLACASPVSMNVWNITGYLVNYAILPYLFWKAPRPHRFVCAILLLFFEFLFEMATGLVFACLGIPLDRDTGGLEFFVVRCCNIALFLVMGRVAARVVAHTLGQSLGSPQRPHRAGRLAGTRQHGRSYLLFFLMQFIFIAQATLLLMTYRNNDPRVYLIMVALIAACFAVDVIALASWKRFAAAERARTHAAYLERQLDTHLAAVDAMREEAGRAARFRHDERNHLQALMSLIESGQTTRAASYAAELRQALSTEGERA